MLVPGSMVSCFRVEALIGEGGMGEVYKGYDTELNRPVAIKALNPDLTSDTNFVQRFRQEAQIQARLIHPNIVSLFTLREEFGTYYMIMEYAPGKTLRDLINTIGPIPEKRAVKILSQVLEGLKFAHNHGIIHRDIKPSNIIVDDEDNVKILDFGIARIVGAQGLTRTGQNLGTVYYMSPEQVRAEKDIDGRSDIFNLGVTFFEMLTGRIPYNTDTASDYTIMDEIVNRPLDDPRKYYEHISENAVTVLKMMVEKDRGKRFASCDAVLNALRGIAVPPRQSFPSASPAANHPSGQYQEFQQYQSGPVPVGQTGPAPKTYMTEAILVTIFCCLPFGIAAIVNAAQANSAVGVGDFQAAQAAAAKAKRFVNISFLVGLVVGVIYFVTSIAST